MSQYAKLQRKNGFLKSLRKPKNVCFVKTIKYSQSFSDKFHVVKVIQFSFFYLCFLLTHKYKLGRTTHNSTWLNLTPKWFWCCIILEKKERQKRKLQHHKNKLLLPHRISLSSKPIACYKLYLVRHTLYTNLYDILIHYFMIIIDYFLMQSFLPYFQLFVRLNLCGIKFEILGKNKL